MIELDVEWQQVVGYEEVPCFSDAQARLHRH